MPNIDAAVSTAKRIAADDSHGYSQDNRDGNPDFDCSSFVAHCLREAGFDVAADSWTGNLYDGLTRCGFVSVKDNADRQDGDIFLTPGKHVVMCISKDEIAHASINEKGKIVGGKPGDQTGKEICIRKFYTPSYGWKHHLRYAGKTEETETGKVGSYLAPKLLVDIIDGKYGVYPEREEKIKRMGLDYDTVRYLVNETIRANEGL